VESYFGHLPPELFRQGVLLRHHLAHRYSDTGQFADILSRPTDPPWLYLHFWLLDDWEFPEGAARQALERRLLLAMVALFCATSVHDAILDDDSAFDAGFRGLERALSDAAASQLAALFPPAAPFWDHHRAFMAASSQAMAKPAPQALQFSAKSFKETAGPADPASLEDYERHLADRLAWVKIPAAAVALHGGGPRASRLAPLLDLLDRVSVIHQIWHEVLAVRRDAHRGFRSYPIARAMREAGLEPSARVPPERLLGALVLTGAMSRLARECLAQLDECRASAHALDLPTLAAHLAAVAVPFHELDDLFSMGGAPRPAARLGPTRLSFADPHDSLAEALAMAEGYLLADRTFRESWEVQRRGVFGSTEVIGRVFAPGLILELLRQHRADLAGEVSALLDRMAVDGYRYYPYPGLPPDADDLGLALRLCPYAAGQARHRQQLERPLRWMAANILETGQIACWFTRGVDGLEVEALSLWGQACATVEANLLLGLLAHDAAAHRAVIEASAAQWLDRWQASGLGANALYVSSCALWTALRLVHALADAPQLHALRARVDRVREIVAERVREEAGRVAAPQEAAFMTMICLQRPAPALTPDQWKARGPDDSSLASLFDPDWIRLLLKRQRYDGGWMGEPLFVTPTRAEAPAWYASHSVTTAYCYHALRVYDAWRSDSPTA
jgi:hypothetical protein